MTNEYLLKRLETAVKVAKELGRDDIPNHSLELWTGWLYRHAQELYDLINEQIELDNYNKGVVFNPRIIAASQCSQLRANDQRCRNFTLNLSGLCYAHGGMKLS